LSYSVTVATLLDLFSPFGDVQSAQVIQDRDSGRSKGFGFVEMSSDADAQQAISAMHEKDHDGRPLTVNEAKPRESRGAGAGRGGYGRR
jgi:RNA recognition motif-containing protein